MTFDPEIFQSVCATAREASLFQSAGHTLEWDERTGMPPEAGEYRAEQVAALHATAHRLRTSAQYGEQLLKLAEQLTEIDPHGDEAATVRNLNRDYQRDQKLPTELVSRISKATTRGQQAWDHARRNDSFADFRDALSEVLSLKREAAERMAEGTGRTAYEALLDEYEPDARIADLQPIFAELKSQLSRLIAEYDDSGDVDRLRILQQDFPPSAQRELSRMVAESVGFDFQRGRLDETSHPFCTTLGPSDCRILSRYEKNWLPGGLYGTLHEAGHGMYEQGLRKDWFGLPPGTYVSLGIHESQSRLWENQVGRSGSFCRWVLPHLNQFFPDAFSNVDASNLYEAVNVVRPSLIRVEADEATYNLHILIRFELEQQLLSGALSVDDLPAAWNEQYRQCLGIEPPSDADGVLQDVHWSAGLIGYFPTYTLGNLAAAQLYDAAEKDLSDLDGMIERGEFQPLLQWLREKIHVHGRCYAGNEQIERATGKPLSAGPLLNYLERKLQRA